MAHNECECRCAEKHRQEQERHNKRKRPACNQHGEIADEYRAYECNLALEHWESGFAELVHSRDYLIAADSLVISGTAVIPKPGDRIEELLNGQTLVHDVMSPDQGKPCWRYSDPYRRTMRIHTKQTEVN